MLQKWLRRDGRSWLVALACLSSLAWATPAAAHPVVADGDPSDWTMAPPSSPNLGHLGRSASLGGEYVWRDAVADERTDFATPDTRVDITEVRTTSDATNLYFLVRMQDIDLASGDGAPQVQIAIAPPSVVVGQQWLGMNCDTQVSPAAAWQRLVVTRFGSGQAPFVFDPAWTDLNGGQAAASISATSDVIEIAVPWALLGGVPAGPVHFTVVSLRANGADDAWDIAGVPDVLDAVTNYGDPGGPITPVTTWTEFAAPGDVAVDYHFELWFGLDPDVEPSPPVVVNEVMYDTPCTEPASEWIELYNRTGIDGFAIAGFVVSDEETANGTEGARVFPAGATMPAAGVRLVANNAATFATCFPSAPAPDFQFVAAVGPPQMPTFGMWASGTVNLSNTGDEVLLLDRYGTIVDVLVWDTGAYPGVQPAPDVAADHSLERPQPRGDSNVCSVDFVDHGLAAITPGKVFALGVLGVGCGQWIECASDHCTDGVCCESDCAGTCEGTCGNTGTCNPVSCPLPLTPCELDNCDPVSGCVAAQGTTCSDGDGCTQTDACDSGGNCVGSDPVQCSPLDACHVAGLCDPGTSSCSDPNAADGTACPGGTCLAGACIAGGGGSGGSGGVAQGGTGGVAQGGTGGVAQGGTGGVGGVVQGGAGGVGGVAQGGTGGVAQGGSGGSGTGAQAGSGTGGSGTGAQGGNPLAPGDSGRCGCRLVGESSPETPSFLGLLALVGLVGLRRRRAA